MNYEGGWEKVRRIAKVAGEGGKGEDEMSLKRSVCRGVGNAER